MDLFNKRTALLLATFALATGCTESVSADNDSVGSVNGVLISSAVMDIYAPGRLRKPLEDITDEERAEVLTELQDLFLLAEIAKKEKLDRKPDVAAQLSLQRRSVLAQALVSNYIESNPVTDEELQAGYDKLVSETTGEQYKARHILVRAEDEAKEIIQQLSSSKTDFAELAKEKSTGPSAPQGGDLGWFSPDSMVKPFSDAVIAMKDGEITQTPVQTQFGWHVILREESKPNTPPPFAEVTEGLRPGLEQEKFQGYLAKQRETANLESAF